MYNITREQDISLTEYQDDDEDDGEDDSPNGRVGQSQELSSKLDEWAEGGTDYREHHHSPRHHHARLPLP